MTQEERLAKIKDLLQEKNRLSTREIMSEFGISFDTARRDIIRLAKTGQATRVHGGIIGVRYSAIPGYNVRRHIESPVKKQMAKIIAGYIRPQCLYYFDTSTTVGQVCHLLGGINTTVMTNSIDNAAALMENKYPQVKLLGGQIDKVNHYTYSMESLEKINNYGFTMAVIGATAIYQGSIYTSTEAEAAMNKRAAANSRKVLVIAENYKFDLRGKAEYKIMDCKDADIIVTDSEPSDQIRQNFGPRTVFKWDKK